MIVFTVDGTPITQGSKVGFIRGGRVSLVDMSDRKTKTMPADRLKNWRKEVGRKAARSMGETEPTSEPVRVECFFIFARPKSHLLKSGRLRKGAPRYPRQDCDKLFRAIGDALTGIVYVDDSQITAARASKAYSESGKSWALITVGGSAL